MLKALWYSIPSPSLTFKSVAYHTMSVVSGVAFCFTFAASHKVDLYAIWDAMGKVYADTLSLVALVLPLAGLFAAGWRTWKMRQVPQNAIAVVPTSDEHPSNLTVSGVATGGQTFSVSGKVV